MTMRERKAARLRELGWRTGSAADFLGLSPEEAAYVEVKLRLAEGLRRRRAEQDLTQAALAEAVGSSQSRVAKMERADATVSLDLLIRALLSLGATRRDLARMIEGK
jgi:DNA-binding XRE family transcriptional regulator